MKQDTIYEFKLSAPKTVKATRELNWNVNNPHSAGLPPVTISEGTTIEVRFSENQPNRLFIYDEKTGRVLKSRVETAYQSFTGFRKPPGMNSLTRMMNDGISTTPTGKRTEPDGHGDDGSPSWLLVMGLI